jgi:hypothetical protein
MAAADKRQQRQRELAAGAMIDSGEGGVATMIWTAVADDDGGREWTTMDKGREPAAKNDGIASA